MSHPKIGSIISFSTNEWRFLEACITHLKPFSEQILVTVCDHLFQGKEENYGLLETLYHRFSEIAFVEFAYDPVRSYRFYSTLSADHPHMRHEWHNVGRWIGWFFLDNPIEYVYFCDADEIADNARFSRWLNTFDLQRYSALRLASFRYFREARFQAKENDITSTFVRRNGFDWNRLWSEHERMGVYLEMPGEKWLGITGGDGKPLVHHYSWVRTKEEMLQKVVSWGHYWERDWEQLIEDEYSHPFEGIDFVRHQEYTTVEPYFDPLQVSIPVVEQLTLNQHLENIKRLSNVTYVTREMMFQKELLHAFNIERH